MNKPAPLAPELAMKEDLHGKERQKQLKTDKVIYHLVMAKKKNTLLRSSSSSVGGT